MLGIHLVLLLHHHPQPSPTDLSYKDSIPFGIMLSCESPYGVNQGDKFNSVVSRFYVSSPLLSVVVCCVTLRVVNNPKQKLADPLKLAIPLRLELHEPPFCPVAIHVQERFLAHAIGVNVLWDPRWIGRFLDQNKTLADGWPYLSYVNRLQSYTFSPRTAMPVTGSQAIR